jgi:calcium-dependent protein kinase
MNKIAHRDLKPENVMFSESKNFEEIKIIDFGLSKSYDGRSKGQDSIVGTPYYVAPEVLNGKYGLECDCWSIGVMMYIILSGLLPFSGKTPESVFKAVKLGEYSFNHKEFENVSDVAKDLITKLLEKDTNKRFTCA